MNSGRKLVEKHSRISLNNTGWDKLQTNIKYQAKLAISLLFNMLESSWNAQWSQEFIANLSRSEFTFQQRFWSKCPIYFNIALLLCSSLRCDAQSIELLISFNFAQSILYLHGCSVAALIWHILFWVSIFRKLNLHNLFAIVFCMPKIISIRVKNAKKWVNSEEKISTKMPVSARSDCRRFDDVFCAHKIYIIMACHGIVSGVNVKGIKSVK